MTRPYHVLVIGGGHAGIEAAWAAAKFGASVALLVGNPATVGRMPCNPSVGGPGKSQLVFELAALGGLMPHLADATAIHTRTLNASKGPAVQSLRVQNERDEYASLAQEHLFSAPIDVIRGEAADLAQNASGDWDVRCTDGRSFLARSVVVAAGTFLRGQTWYGRNSRKEGRQGEPPARHLSAAFERAGHALRRFKTGTPPRLHADSVAFDELEIVPADNPARSFTGKVGPNATASPTWQTQTTPETHALVRENIADSAMYAGDIHATGARYCPSIEDKIMRFAHHDRHLLFVEPEGLKTSEIYLQGFSSSLPPLLQDRLIATLPGFAKAVVQRYAYAVEYDVIDATELTLNLESKRMRGVFSAGQINGTSGYEEAAMQGLVAGTAAARRSLGLPEIFFEREEGYVGVMLDDLVLKGSDEPLRMMTSRVEHRLLSRQDNADQRFAAKALELGLTSAEQKAAVDEKYARVAAAAAELEKTRLDSVSLATLLKRPEESLASLAEKGAPLPELAPAEAEALEINIKYEGYIKRARQNLRSEQKAKSLSLEGVDYHAVRALSLEGREKLLRLQPRTVEQASRIAGVRHADIGALLVHLRTTSSERPQP